MALTMLRALAEPEAPAVRRHLTSDGTAEKLGEVCRDNPTGIMVHHDELLALFADLDNPAKASLRGFYLTGWRGQEGYTFDRIMRGMVRIEAVKGNRNAFKDGARSGEAMQTAALIRALGRCWMKGRRKPIYVNGCASC